MRMTSKSTLFWLMLPLVLASNFLCAETRPSASFKNTMQQIVDDYYKSHSKKEGFTAVAASVLLPQDKTQNGHDIQTVVVGTMGLAPFNQPIKPSDLFEIGSITKSFTALIVLQLQTEGKLSLEDKLGKWLPEYTQWKKITLRQLLTMTSGIPNYSDEPAFLKALYANLARVWTNQELLAYAHPEKPIKMNAQNAFDYSNSNYILAALIIEKITNDTFEHQLQQRILNKDEYFANTFYPLGADAASILKEINKRRIHGYYFDNKTNHNIDTFKNNLSWAGSAGALLANTEDVVHWVQLLYHGLLIEATYRERALAEMEAVVSLKTGKRIPTVTAEDPKGFGLGIGYFYDKATNQRFWAYEGSTLGFRVMYLWQPCNDVTTVVALNSKAGEGSSKTTISDDIAQANLALYQAILQQYPNFQCGSIK